MATADRRPRTRGAGWEYLHVAIDDATRLTCAEVLAAEDGATCAALLHAAPITHTTNARPSDSSRPSCASGLSHALSQLSQARRPALRPCLRFDNHQHPHMSLGRRPHWMRFREAV